MKQQFYIMSVLLFALAIAGCSEKDVSSENEVKEEKTRQESTVTKAQEIEQSGDNSSTAIQKVGDLYMLVDQTQDLQFLKETDHTYENADKLTHMVMEAGVSGEKFLAALDAGAVMSTYYMYYWRLFEAHDKGWLTYTVDGTSSRFPLSEMLDNKLYTDVRAHIYQFHSGRQVKQPEFRERTVMIRTADCSYSSSDVDTCTFVGQSHEITGFTLQDGTMYSYPHGRSAGKMSTALDEEVLKFYFDDSGLLWIETADGREVKVTPEMLLIFAKIEELAKFMLEEAAREEMTVSPEDRLTAKEASQVIIDVIRLASQEIEHAINGHKIKGTVNGKTTVYQLDHIQKVVKDFGSHIMSATYIDGALAFVQRVDPATKKMLRYYFAEGQLIRILREAGELIHFEVAADQAHFLKIEQALLTEY